MENHEGHSHGKPTVLKNVGRAFIIGMVLNMLYVIVEFGAGFYYNSLALMSDAGHNLSDVASLGLSFFAYRIAKAAANKRYTYGYHKSTILASLVNAIILLVAVGAIGWEAIQRFNNPVEINGVSISVVAGIGIVINAFSAFLFFRDKEKDLNVKGAYLHLAADALVSLGVVIAGILITYTGIEWIDPAISLVIMIVVLVSTWGLLRESLKLSLDGVPENIDFDKVKQAADNITGVKDFHHLHIWAISTTKNAMTGHLVVANDLTNEQEQEIKREIKHRLEHLNIHHCTIEFEKEGEKCDEGEI